MPAPPPTDVHELSRYLGTFTNFEKLAPLPAQRRQLGPRRAQALMEACGLLPLPVDVKVVQVAGSKGKGSTVLWLEQMLEASGHSTGATLSPHLVRLNERIRIRQQDATDEQLLEWVSILHPLLQQHLRQSPDLHPTFFDYWTTLSALAFRESAVSHWLLEVGLGGPLDSTSAIPHDVGVLTLVDLEHTEWLGPDIDSIAREKSRIARCGKPFVLGVGSDSWRIPAREVANAQGAYCVDAAHVVAESSTEIFPSLKPSADVERPLVAPPSQLRNRTCAAAAYQALTGHAAPTVEAPTLPGRLQLWPADSDGRLLLLDSAHTQESLRAFCEYAEQWRRSQRAETVTVVLGILQDKGAMFSPLAPAMRSVHANWIAVAPPNPRALPAEGLSRTLRPLDIVATPLSLDAALAKLRRSSTPVAVTGSFYLAGWFRERW